LGDDFEFSVYGAVLASHGVVIVLLSSGGKGHLWPWSGHLSTEFGKYETDKTIKKFSELFFLYVGGLGIDEMKYDHY